MQLRSGRQHKVATRQHLTPALPAATPPRTSSSLRWAATDSSPLQHLTLCSCAHLHLCAASCQVLLLTFCNLRWAQTAALDAARKALENTRSRAPSRPDPSRTFSYTDTKYADVLVAPGCTTRRMSSRG